MRQLRHEENLSFMSTNLVRDGRERFTQRVLGPLIATPSGGGRNLEEPCRIDNRDPIPVNEPDQFGELAVEPVDRIPNLRHTR